MLILRDIIFFGGESMMKKQSQNEFVGSKIRKYRKAKKITQEELAEKIGIKNNTISAYERGVIEVPHSKLLEVAKVLEIKYTHLLPIEGDVNNSTISDYINKVEEELNEDQQKFLESLIEKTLSLSEDEREDFLKNIRFAVEFFKNK